MGHIDSGKKQGATVHLGGERHGSEGFFIQPTIFTDVTPEMTIVKEEIFGPVVVIAKFKDQEELLKLANDSFYGLAASVFSSDITKAITTANALEAGTVWINMANIPEKNMPFGGYKRALLSFQLCCLWGQEIDSPVGTESGMGRDLGEEAVAGYTETKAIHINLTGLPPF